nr:uncharacterized protein LOC109432723 [Aedes albopictus]
MSLDLTTYNKSAQIELRLKQLAEKRALQQREIEAQRRMFALERKAVQEKYALLEKQLIEKRSNDKNRCQMSRRPGQRKRIRSAIDCEIAVRNTSPTINSCATLAQQIRHQSGARAEDCGSLLRQESEEILSMICKPAEQQKSVATRNNIDPLRYYSNQQQSISAITKSDLCIENRETSMRAIDENENMVLSVVSDVKTLTLEQVQLCSFKNLSSSFGENTTPHTRTDATIDVDRVRRDKLFALNTQRVRDEYGCSWGHPWQQKQCNIASDFRQQRTRALVRVEHIHVSLNLICTPRREMPFVVLVVRLLQWILESHTVTLTDEYLRLDMSTFGFRLKTNTLKQLIYYCTIQVGMFGKQLKPKLSSVTSQCDEVPASKEIIAVMLRNMKENAEPYLDKNDVKIVVISPDSYNDVRFQALKYDAVSTSRTEGYLSATRSRAKHVKSNIYSLHSATRLFPKVIELVELHGIVLCRSSSRHLLLQHQANQLCGEKASSPGFNWDEAIGYGASSDQKHSIIWLESLYRSIILSAPPHRDLEPMVTDDLDNNVTKMLAATTHLNNTTVDFQIKSYVYECRPDGLQIIHLGRACEKLLLAVRCIASIDCLGEVFPISTHSYGQRNHYTEKIPTAGSFTPGAFIKQIQPTFREMRLLIIIDPQLVTEASYVSTSAIVFCNTELPVKFADIAIPSNNKSPYLFGPMCLLDHKVLRLRGKITHDKWEVKPNPEDSEKEQALEAALAANDLYPEEPIVVDETNFAGDDAALPASTSAAAPVMQTDYWNDDATQTSGSWEGGGNF